jgi:4-alpha-glucanotransferase
MNVDAVEQLARLRGIGDAYHDYRGELRHFSIETKAALLRAMRIPVLDGAALAAAAHDAEAIHWNRLVAPVLAVRTNHLMLPFVAPSEADWITLYFDIKLEGGGHLQGEGRIGSQREVARRHLGTEWVRREIGLPAELPVGYHKITVRIGDRDPVTSTLICAPARCYEPEALTNGDKLWGIVAQLYTLRSESNWGHGDFADLRLLVARAAQHGAAFVGLNPLHALFPSDPQQCSPYSASSRVALNVLYIAPMLVPGYAECPALRQLESNSEFQARLARARGSQRVDYELVAGLKFEAFERLFAHFREAHLAPNTARGRAFRAFVIRGGTALRLHATFDALDAHLRRTLGTQAGWQNWPPEYRQPESAAVRKFEERFNERVQFYSYLQWLATEQLAGAQALARELGMAIGLYCDYAVGANASGSETWSDQSLYCLGAGIGAPPDELALKGQDWGIPPLDPAALERAHFQPFVRLIRSNVNTCGALRIDHVMALFRQWWVPHGVGATGGGYVHYPIELLLAIVALESARAKTLVVGEDLGTVPAEMQAAMQSANVFHYKVLLFERDGDTFKLPTRYEPRALATVTTHDLPTLHAWWQGDDIALRAGLNLYPSESTAHDLRAERAADRARLLEALASSGVWSQSTVPEEVPYSDALTAAVHAYLASSASALVAVQIEDLIGMTEPINVPGTHTEFPNWRRVMTQSVEAIFARAEVAALLAVVAAARRGRA